jgi:putative glutamine amidotransferase
MRPFIGLTTSTTGHERDAAKPAASHLSLAYSQSIIRAGGLPLLLPNSLPPEGADDIVFGLHGLVLCGGGDVDPLNWGEPPHPKLGIVDPQRDTLEMALLHAALRREVPVLGICRGVQLMAVALGGDLWQDIPSQLPDSGGHFQPLPRHETHHPVRVAPDSTLARIFQPDPDAQNSPCVLQVNSFHHQAVRQCGRSLAPIAWSEDEIIEALVAPDAQFVLGVQWHPEEMTASDPLQARLFAAFVQASREYATRTLPA